MDISHSTGITGCLSILLCHKLSSLETLILHDCGLNSHDARNLAQANVGGRLLYLKHLDISKNYITTDSQSIFSFSCQWEHLECLSLNQVTPADEAFHFMINNHQERFLQTLTISLKQVRLESGCLYRVWHNVSKLHIHSSHLSYTSILEHVAGAVEVGIFPNLTNVCSHVIFPKIEIDAKEEMDILFRQLLQHNLPTDLCRQVIDVVPRVTLKTHALLDGNANSISFERGVNSQIDSIIKALTEPMTAVQEDVVRQVVKARLYSGGKMETKSEILAMTEVLTPLLPLVKQRLRDKNISVFLFSASIRKGEAYQPEARTKLIKLNGFRL